MTERAPSGSRGHSVVARVLFAYALAVLSFAVAAGWSALALRSAASEASLMRGGYYPLALTVRALVAAQGTYTSQLNHVTAAKNFDDVRAWLGLALRGRPEMFRQVRADLDRAFLSSGNSAARRVGEELVAEVAAIERLSNRDGERVQRLFEALEQSDAPRAEKLRDELVQRGADVSSRLGRLEERVAQEVDRLLDQARGRERLALQLLVALIGVSLLVGFAMAVYARRVLAPLAAVTARAKAVAEGDLDPRSPIVSGDELGELSRTFEGMVAAIARANEQLVASERLATIGKMAAHVTHEIRNPLSSIALNLELLEEEFDADASEAKGLVRAIGGEVERLNSLSRQYLSFARQSTGRFSDEDLGEVVREACEFVRRELLASGIRLDLEIQDALGAVPVDEGQVKQALFNLLRNAREAMPHGGGVRVRVRAVEGGAEIQVDDEGTGIDADARARLFEPFFTTKRHGTGLGLAITQQIVAAHGGSIEFRDRAGERGTRVIIFLPRPVERELPAETAAISGVG